MAWGDSAFMKCWLWDRENWCSDLQNMCKT